MLQRCAFVQAVFISILQRVCSVFQRCESNFCAYYNLGWSVQFLSFFLVILSNFLIFEAVWQKKLLVCFWTTSSTFSRLEFSEYLDVSVFSFPAAPFFCYMQLGWAGQPRSRSKANRSFLKNFRRRLPFSAFQPSRLPWPWQWIRKWKWHLRVSSKFRTLWLVLKMCNNIAASKSWQLPWPWQWHLCLRSLSKRAIRKWEWGFPRNGSGI